MDTHYKSAFIYSDEFAQYSYGPHHPMRPIRLKLTHDLLQAYGVFTSPEILKLAAEPATESEILLFHTPEYIAVLRGIDQGEVPLDAYRYGLGPGDNPIFPGVYRFSLLITGASLQAGRLVKNGHVPVAFNMAGGLHHALSNQASGFCYIDDPVIIMKELVQQGLRVIYLDIDVHHGDGVQIAFYDTDQVMTISVHEDGHYLFPGTGFVHEMGQGVGLGYSVNLPLYPGTDDETYLWAFEQVVPPLVSVFQPNILVTQLGVDTFVDDPLAHLRLTTYGFCRVIEQIKKFAIPWVALGGGGYHIANVARAWTLAYALMNDLVLPDEIPIECLEPLRQHGLKGTHLRDAEPTRPETQQIRRYAEQSVLAIQKNIFPFHQLAG